ncbi:MAG: hypothetical protein HYS23_03120 [Geobacter sp.]|nr:hypothetical protein [Geobacter sp.]
MLLFLTGCVPRPFLLNSGKESDVVIMQDGKPAPTGADGAILLRRDAFEIRSRWSAVSVCVTRSVEDIGKIGVGIDTRREQGTCFNAKRSYSMGRDADYLVLGDGFNALNTPHGMRKTEWYYLFTVLAFHDSRSRKEMPLIQARGRYHAVLWVDRNGDMVLDGGEFLIIELVFD